jgi:hypothetical protein
MTDEQLAGTDAGSSATLPRVVAVLVIGLRLGGVTPMRDRAPSEVALIPWRRLGTACYAVTLRRCGALAR